MIAGSPRVALFADCFHEVNGVSLTCRKLVEFVRGRGLPFLTVHGGPEDRVTTEGSVVTFEYKRSALAFRIDVDMRFDPLFLLRRKRVIELLGDFRPDIVHITGPGDCGILGAVVAHDLCLPLAASWHTNLHTFAARRLETALGFVSARYRAGAASFAERGTLRATLRFYRIANMLLAPNPELVSLLERRTGKPAFLMRRGVETETFSPERRDRAGGDFVIGYVGRLKPEKSVRLFAEIERNLLDRGDRGFRFLIVGHGSEQPWLEAHLRNATFTGALRGAALSRAYANMDAFVFPSETDTFGNVVLEALASGLPAIVSAEGGPKFVVRHSVDGFVAHRPSEFADYVHELLNDSGRRERMSRAAREAALDASWDGVFEELYSAYGRLRGTPQGQSGSKRRALAFAVL